MVDGKKCSGAIVVDVMTRSLGQTGNTEHGTVQAVT